MTVVPTGTSKDRTQMKMIVAIIRPEKLEAVQQALNERDVYLMTVSDVRGCGRQRGYTEVYRGTEFQVRLLPKLKLEIAVNDAFVEATVEAIVHAARTGEPARSATARSSSCRWTTASASAPANAAARPSDRDARARPKRPTIRSPSSRTPRHPAQPPHRRPSLLGELGVLGGLHKFRIYPEPGIARRSL